MSQNKNHVTKPKTLEDYWRNAEKYINEGKFDLAEKSYLDANEAYPEHFNIHNNLGRVYYLQNKFDQAEQEYKKSLEQNNEDQIAHYNLGELYRVQGTPETLSKAVTEYKKVIAINSKHEGAYYYLGGVYRSQGEFRLAAETYEKLLKINPEQTDPNYYYYLGLSYYDLNEFASAETALTNYIDVKPADQVANYFLGDSYLKQGKTDLAKQKFHDVLRLDNLNNSHELAKMQLGNILSEEAAREYYNDENDDSSVKIKCLEVLKLNAKNFKCHEILGNIHHREGNKPLATQEFREAILINPESIKPFHYETASHKATTFTLLHIYFDEAFGGKMENVKENRVINENADHSSLVEPSDITHPEL